MKTSSRYWTKITRQRLIDGLRKYGKDWLKMKQIIPERTIASIKSYSYAMKAELEKSGEDKDVLRILGMPKAYMHTYFMKKGIAQKWS